MTWFQGVAIQLAVRFDVLGSSTNLSDRSAALAFQNYLVCAEMFLPALAQAGIDSIASRQLAERLRRRPRRHIDGFDGASLQVS